MLTDWILNIHSGCLPAYAEMTNCTPASRDTIKNKRGLYKWTISWLSILMSFIFSPIVHYSKQENVTLLAGGGKKQ